MLDSVAFEDGAGVLAWQSTDVRWDDGVRMAENGTMDPTLAISGGVLALRADETNYVASGDFTAPEPWRFEDGRSGAVAATWDPIARRAEFAHASPQSLTILFDPLDRLVDIQANWTVDSYIGSTSTPAEAPMFSVDGNGSLRDTISLGAAPESYAGVKRTGVVNWSSVDRLLLWVYLTSVTPPAPVAFAVAATSASGSFVTTRVPLRVGEWQRIVVDLDELGPDRTALGSVSLRFLGQSVDAVAYLDDVRLARAKVFGESARAAQDVTKANATAADPGNAVLAFDWSLADLQGPVAVDAAVHLTGPNGTSAWPLPTAGPGPWKRLVFDVSSAASLPGTYNVSIDVAMTADSIAALSARILLDNVSLTLPGRRNGTFVSHPLDLGQVSRFGAFAWAGDVPNATTAVVGARSGSGVAPQDVAWNEWIFLDSPGAAPSSLAPGRFLQIRADLGTSNASRTARVTSILVEARHRAPSGALVTPWVTARPDFLFWRAFNASGEGPGRLDFAIDNGTGFRNVSAGSGLFDVGAATVRLSVRLATSNPLETPAIRQIELVYDYRGPIVAVEIVEEGALRVPSGRTVGIRAIAFDEGRHPVPTAFVWSTDNPGGRIDDLGRFSAGEVGEWNVTALALGTDRSDTVRITVVPAIFDPAEILLHPAALASIALAAIAYVGYGLAVRRLFSVDDLFIVARDGRLILHNTRRMRPEWDEDTFAGMLTAISAFVRDSFREEEGTLNRFEFSGKTVLIERLDSIYVAAIYSGRVPRWAPKGLRAFVDDLEARYGERLRAWSGSREDLDDLRGLTDRFVGRVRYRRIARIRRAS